MKNFLGIVTGIIVLIILFLSLDYLFLKWFVFIEPQKEDARREVFLHTRSYIESKTQDLIKYRYEYMKASGDEKEIIANTIRHAFAEFDESKLKSLELQNFLKNIKYGE